MGTCSSDIYKTIKKQYGQAFEQFVIQKQSQIKMKDWIQKKEEQFQQQLVSKAQSLNKEVSQKEHLLDANFAQSKLLLQSQLPYGVTSFEQMKKTSLENLLGLNESKKKFSVAHNLIKNESAKRTEEFAKKGVEILKKLEGDAKIDHEKLKAFHDLPEEKRKFIFEKGVKQFEGVINAKVTELQNKSGNELNFEADLKSLENAISLKELDEAVNRSRTHFRTEVANIVGSNADSGIKI